MATAIHRCLNTADIEPISPFPAVDAEYNDCKLNASIKSAREVKVRVNSAEP